MDFESERVLNLIFPNGVEQHVLENPELVEYLVKLGSYKTDQLKKEESRLSEEIKTVVEHTQDLAISNYKTFILTSECSRDIYRDFKETEKKLGDLVQDLPNFSKVCEEFMTKSTEINANRRLNSMTLKKNAQILEVLELPQQMDSFIKSGKYENALELASYVQRMGSKHGQIPIIQNVVKSIEGSWHTMLVQLLAQLKTDLQLPKCLQVIGYLRRMQAFGNQELRLKFLQARDFWLNNLLASIPSNDPQQHLSKTIEVTRINVFNIITQYKAIFGKDDQSGPSNCIKDNSGNKIFYAWLHQRVNSFLKTLETDLNRSVSSMETILGQCMYFGLSFSRVGADFRGLMAPIFVKTISQRFTNLIVTATKQFNIEMENYTLINKMTGGLSRSSQKMNSEDENSENISPPESLLDFRPLANYCNGILNAFNELRLCAPLAIANPVTKAIESSLQQIAFTICAFYRQEQQAFSSNERDNFVRMCSCFVIDLCPYLQRCIHCLFPVKTMAAQLGINILALQKEGLTYLDQKLIVKPIEHLLPATEMVVSQIEKKKSEAIEGDPEQIVVKVDVPETSQTEVLVD